jgi:hypothetical protein
MYLSDPEEGEGRGRTWWRERTVAWDRMADMSSKYASLVGPAELAGAAAAAMSSEKVVASGLRWEVGGGAGLTYSTNVQSSTRLLVALSNGDQVENNLF